MKNQIIAAVRDDKLLVRACSSDADIIFDLVPNIETIEESAKLSRESGKLLFVHIDLAEGIGKDKYGLKFLKNIGVSGIISTRSAMIKLAKELGLKTVQRIFVLDKQSIDSAVLNLKTKPDMVEIMPGVIPKAITQISASVDMPVIAGGLIGTADEAESALAAGAFAVSTSTEALWTIKG